MTEIRRGGGVGAAQPARLSGGPRGIGASDRRVKAQAARLLVSLAKRLVRATGRAYRAGIVGLPQVESVVSLSGRLRNYARRLAAPGEGSRTPGRHSRP
jgi:hypothetical protein